MEYKYNPEHEKAYKKALATVDIKDLRKRTIRHRDAWAPALATLKDKEVDSVDEGVELLADAIMAYRKAAKVPGAINPEDRHYVIAEVRQLIDSEDFREKFGSDPETIFKKGDAHLILTQFFNTYKAMDLEGKLDYQARGAMPKGADFDFYHGMAQYHATLHPTRKYSKGDLAKMATEKGILGAVKHTITQEIENQIRGIKPKKKPSN